MPGLEGQQDGMGEEAENADQRAEDRPGLEKEKGNINVGQVRQVPRAVSSGTT